MEKSKVEDKSKTESEFNDVSQGPNSQLAGRDIINNYVTLTSEQFEDIAKNKNIEVKVVKNNYFYIANQKLDNNKLNFKDEIISELESKSNADFNKIEIKNYEAEFNDRLTSLENYIDKANKNISDLDEILKIYCKALDEYNNDAKKIKDIVNYLDPNQFHNANYYYVYDQIAQLLSELKNKCNPFYILLNPIIYHLKSDDRKIEDLKIVYLANSLKISNGNNTNLIKYYDKILNFLILIDNTDHIIDWLTGTNLTDKIFCNNHEELEKCIKIVDQYRDRTKNGFYDSSKHRDVFIAYSSADLDDIIYDDVLNFLECNGITCYLADRNLKIVDQDSYDPDIDNAIDNCTLFLYVLTNNSIKSDCKAHTKELPYALNKGKKILFYQPNQKKPVAYASNNCLKNIIDGDKDRVGQNIFKLKTTLLNNIKKNLCPTNDCKEENNKEQYSITYNNILDANTSILPKTYTIEDEVILPTINSKVYTFNGWYENGILISNIAKGTTGDKVLEAKWEKIEDASPSSKSTEKVHEDYKYNLLLDGNGYELIDINNYTGTNIVIPSKYNDSSVSSIGKSVFEDCTNLISITIPSSIISIDESAFYNCKNLESVYYNGTIEDWCNIKFSDDDSNPMKYASHFYLLNSENTTYTEVTEIEIPNTITTIGEYQFYGFSNVTNITIPSGVTSIGNQAFVSCTSLTNITIPSSTSIGFATFSNCNNFKNVYYNGTIEDWCNNINFKYLDPTPLMYYVYCNQGTIKFLNSETNEYEELVEIEIPNTITTIGYRQFFGFSNVTSITIPSSVTSIRDESFSHCESLTSITIPSSVKSIEESAFEDCTSLTNVCYNGTKEDWSKISIGKKNSKLTKATIQYNLDLKYMITFETNGGSTIVSLVTDGSGKIKAPANPTKEGYTFAGWYFEDSFETSIDLSTYVFTANTTLYAKWIEVKPVSKSKYEKFLDENVKKYNDDSYDIKELNGITYGKSLDGKHYILLKCNKDCKKIRIPKKINGVNVSNIYEDAFTNCNNLKTIDYHRYIFKDRNNPNTLFKLIPSLETINVIDFNLYFDLDYFDTFFNDVFGSKYKRDKKNKVICFRMIASVIYSIFVGILWIIILLLPFIYSFVTLFNFTHVFSNVWSGWIYGAVFICNYVYGFVSGSRIFIYIDDNEEKLRLCFVIERIIWLIIANFSTLIMGGYL